MTTPALSQYRPVIGLETHIELKTASKMFCGCANDPFGASQPNSYTCPVCLGMPGALPVPNKKAIEWTIQMGLALGCKVNLFSHFDRKHYFYPDLPKGYQISQYDLPFCYDGQIETSEGRVRIRRIHLEEDTAKLMHKTIDGQQVSLIDFNRSGVPLIEIVTEPDIHSPEQAKTYAKSLRQLARYLDIADCDMEQGGMRLEANLSLAKKDAQVGELPNYKVEIKNINSFRFLEHAIQYDMQRQAELLAAGTTPSQETRGWSETKGQTFSQRQKEDAADYRYFPDPDIPPIEFTEAEIHMLRNAMPELPNQVVARWESAFGLESRHAWPFLESQADCHAADTVWALAKTEGIAPNDVARALINHKVLDAQSQPLTIASSAAHLLAAFKASTQFAAVDTAELDAKIQALIQANPKAVQDYHSGKTQILGFFMGQLQRQLGKKLDPKALTAALAQALSKSP